MDAAVEDAVERSDGRFFDNRSGAALRRDQVIPDTKELRNQGETGTPLGEQLHVYLINLPPAELQH
ncbi:hypothetical protein DNTS_015265 [Danionella cerebrum]|uniref:Uncharacterized protein n=1 Tax=Danionella cerebrum TaxID=2873325 RepID=A0A553MSI2_9TELE|nr:hypothetical protein DNTS_015265 [Danionella translucida]